LVELSRARGYQIEATLARVHGCFSDPHVRNAAVDVATEALLLQLPRRDAISDHRPLELCDERELAADELGHRTIAVLLRHGDDRDAVALKDDEGGMVTGKAVEAGDEEHAVLIGLGTFHEVEEYGPVLPRELGPVLQPPDAVSVTTSTSVRPFSTA
jgi:hypothetical protein